jgi:hypothetical protein
MSREPFINYLIQFVDEQDEKIYSSRRKLNAHMSKNTLNIKIFEQARILGHLACSVGRKRHKDFNGFQEFCITSKRTLSHTAKGKL